MSGICGILSFDGSAPTLGQLQAMTALLERRGPDGTHHWLDDGAGLGQTLLATTPEALVEVLPLKDDTSGCVITADARLDNREELIAKMGLPGPKFIGDGGPIGDGELILRAYLHWGQACLEHLLGDFAFGIWDPRIEQLFCARDHMGLRQLIYTREHENRFVFATEVPAVLAGAIEPVRINDGRIADFLESLEGLDFTSTFYADVFRLPPAHCLTCDISGMHIRRYWTLTPGPQLELATSEAYANAFLEVFTEAVRCRLRSPGPIGSMLSGGMDSGSVTAVASRLLAAEGKGPLATFSAVGPDKQNCRETRTIHAAIEMPGLDPHLINHAQLDRYMDDLIRLTATCDEPFDAHMTLLRAVYLAAHYEGLKVVLDGVGGDLALAAGTHIARLLRRGQWRVAWRNLKGEKNFYGEGYSTATNLYWAFRNAFIPNWVKQLKKNNVILANLYEKRHNSLVSDHFYFVTDSRRRRREYAIWFPSTWISHLDERINVLSRTHPAVARERYDRVAAAVAIEPRDPFLDIRVLRLCLSLPADQLLSDGWPKVILRRAMAGLLPDEVRWRKGKEHLGWTFTNACIEKWPGWRQIMRPGNIKLGRFLSPDLMHKIGQVEKIEIESEIVSVFYLSNWLHSRYRSQESEES